MLDNHWYILGAGSIGSLFSCMFQQANISSTLLVRPANSQTTDTSKQITFTRIDGSRHPISLVTQSSLSTQPPIPQLLLTTKAHQSQQAIRSVQSRLSQGAIVVIMQNGMGVAEQLQSQLPHCHVIVATTTEGANRPTTNDLIHAGVGETWLGCLPTPLTPGGSSSNVTRNISTRVAKDIAQQWQTTGLSVQYDEHITQRLWAKLAINCAINPLTVKFQCNNGALLNNPQALALMEQVCQELQRVMSAKNILPKSDLFATAKQVAQNTSNNISSMLQDHRNHRPTEIQHINGYIVNMGKALNIPTPINQALTKEVEGSTFIAHHPLSHQIRD